MLMLISPIKRKPCMLGAVYLLTWGKKYARLSQAPDEVPLSDTRVSP